MISVYMPVYNGEKYIQQSIESIINQTYQDFELILIDDGSTDGSAGICVDYQIRYPDKITFVQNDKNIGIAKTLNRGLALAKGDYVLEVSDDDWIDCKTLEQGMNRINETNADIVLLNRKGAVGERTIHYPEISDSFLGEMTLEKRKKLLTYIVKDAGFVFWGFVKRALIEEQQLYYEDVSPEDIPYVPILMMKANSISVVDGVYYHYRIHDDSIAHKKNSPMYLTIFKSAELMIEKAKRYNCYEQLTEEWEFAFIIAYYYDFIFNQMARFDKRDIDLMKELANYMKMYLPNYQENKYIKQYLKPWQRTLMKRNDDNAEQLDRIFPECDEFLKSVRCGKIEKLLLE